MWRISHSTRGVDDLHHQQAGQPPGQGEAQADIAAQVERLVGVVPPALMEKLLQREANPQFQQGSEEHRAQKEQECVLHKRGEAEDHDDHAKAVDGTDRAVEKAAVDKFTGVQGEKADLQAPAEKGINKKDP